MAFRKNLQVDTLAGVRKLDEVELSAFAGIEGDPADARIADVEFDGIEAQVVLCDALLGMMFVDAQGEMHCWQQEGSRFSRELVMVAVLLKARAGTLRLADLSGMGFDHVVGG